MNNTTYTCSTCNEETEGLYFNLRAHIISLDKEIYNSCTWCTQNRVSRCIECNRISSLERLDGGVCAGCVFIGNYEEMSSAANEELS